MRRHKDCAQYKHVQKHPEMDRTYITKPSQIRQSLKKYVMHVHPNGA